MPARFLFFFLCLAAVPLLAQDPDWVRAWNTAQRERPAEISSQSRLAPPDEPGLSMVLQGHVFQADGTTPAEGAIVFAYQTDANGLYNEKGKPGWRLRGWARTDKSGAFEFTTIRPAPYPQGSIPAHFHFTVEGGGGPRQWTEELRFADDPLLSKSDAESGRQAENFGHVRPIEREGTKQRVAFNIRLKTKADF